MKTIPIQGKIVVNFDYVFELASILVKVKVKVKVS